MLQLNQLIAFIVCTFTILNYSIAQNVTPSNGTIKIR